MPRYTSPSASATGRAAASSEAAAAFSGHGHRRRTRVYVDGFNLFYGCLKGTPYKWLDPVALCRRRLSTHDVQIVRLFSARVVSSPWKPQQASRQQAWFRALRTLPDLTLHLGHFLSHAQTLPAAEAWAQGRYDPVRVWRTEEKGSDVNLATRLLIDAIDDTYDWAIVVSNDSDLAEPIRFVRHRFGKAVGLLSPFPRVAAVLRPLATRTWTIRPEDLAAAQLADEIEDVHGTIRKPAGW
jgi:hypothetical protein